MDLIRRRGAQTPCDIWWFTAEQKVVVGEFRWRKRGRGTKGKQQVVTGSVDEDYLLQQSPKQREDYYW